MSDESAHQASTAGINPLEGEIILKNVHPSFLNWKWRLFFAVLFILAGLTAGGDIGMYMIIFGGLLILSVFLSRSRSRYIVTNQRIKTQVGFLGSSTMETRINNVSGISTNSGIIEGIVGKGTVSITDNARENLYIKGVGNYEELARTLREQQQSVQQHGIQQNPSTQQESVSRSGSSPGLKETQPTTQQGSIAESESVSDSKVDEEAAVQRETADDNHAPSNGTTSGGSSNGEITVESSRGSSAKETNSNPAETQPKTSIHDLSASRLSETVESITEHRQFESTIATNFCETVLDESARKEDLESVLTETLETLETYAVVTDSLSEISSYSDKPKLESVYKNIRNETGELPKNVETVVKIAITTIEESKQNESSYNDELTQIKRERDAFRDVINTLCRAASRSEAITLESDGINAQSQEIAEAISTDKLVFDTPETPIQSAIDDIERSVQPQTQQSAMLLSSLTEPAKSDVTGVLQSAVETIDNYQELQHSLADIAIKDVQRQLDSLDADLQQKDEPVYRHLADRVRELEAMLDRESVDNIQLYAIYQESRFYDRTLIPRLARTTSSPEPLDVGEQIDGIQSRIDAIRTEYVNVRADHNHTIPNHFLELADSLCSRAQRLEREQPQQAAGVLAAAAELLGHIEQLYKRNEYSVMLRRLRG